MFCVADASFRSRFRSSLIAVGVRESPLPQATRTTAVDANVHVMSFRTFPSKGRGRPVTRAPARDYRNVEVARHGPTVNARIVRLITKVRHTSGTETSAVEDSA